MTLCNQRMLRSLEEFKGVLIIHRLDLQLRAFLWLVLTKIEHQIIFTMPLDLRQQLESSNRQQKNLAPLRLRKKKF
jgi:hypothetical protein